MILLLLVLALQVSTIWADPEHARCNILKCGAVGDGWTDDTSAIQSCIRGCASKTVVFPPGNFLVGAIVVERDGTLLHFEGGSQLTASVDRSVYPARHADWYVLLIRDCKGCRITADGDGPHMDGRAQSWVTGINKKLDKKTVRNWKDSTCTTKNQCRPRLFGVRNSTDVAISGFSVKDSVFWTVHIWHSQNVTMSNCTVTGDWMIPNNDGIDIDGSADVLIQDVRVDTADDGICIKAKRGHQPSKNILIHRCTIRSKSSAIKLGSESTGNFRNITVEDIEIEPSHRGIGIQLRDGGTMQGITFRNINMTAQLFAQSWWGAGEAISVTANPREEGGIGSVGHFKDVTFENIRAVSEGGIVLRGSVERTLGSVRIVGMVSEMKKLSDFPGGQRDLQPGYPGLVQDVKVPGVYAENIKTLDFTNLTIKFPDSFASRDDWGDALQVVQHTVQTEIMTNVVIKDAEAYAVQTAARHSLVMGEEPEPASSMDRNRDKWPAPGLTMMILFLGGLVGMLFSAISTSGLIAALGGLRSLPSWRRYAGREVLPSP